jgi:hypothetical protein
MSEMIVHFTRFVVVFTVCVITLSIFISVLEHGRTENNYERKEHGRLTIRD